MPTLHLVSHTHWDREWYRTFQQFRLRLVHLMDSLLHLLDSDRNFKHFMLDGQTIILEDYLQMRPENEEKLRHYIRDRRILIGPWYILPDEFLVSPEATIRNLLTGDRLCRRFGPKMRVGYIPDPFGHIGQMPQILQGFNIHTACVQRGLSDEPCEFWWEAPDGSRVFMAYLRDGYGNAAGLPTSESQRFITEVKRLRDSLLPHSLSGRHLLLMHGTDHMEPPPDTSYAIAAARRQLDGDELIHSTLPDYLTSVQASLRRETLTVVRGELRNPKRFHLLPGVLSTRMWIKQRNRACETLLEKWAEPFSTFARWNIQTLKQANRETFQPSNILREAWKLLMQCHPHDSICGCSIDQVHDEMRPRFDQVEQIGEEITRQSLDLISRQIHTSAFQSSINNPQSAILVFNPLSFTRTDTVSLEVESSVPFNLLDESGKLVPYQLMGLGGKELVHAEMSAAELGNLYGNIRDGRVMGLSILEVEIERQDATVYLTAHVSETRPPDLAAWGRALSEIESLLADPTVKTFRVRALATDKARITFTASDIPGLGWRTFYLVPRPGTEATPTRLPPLARLLLPLAKLPFVQKLTTRPRRARPPYRIENEFFTVEVKRDGTLTLSDKTSKTVYCGLNRFVDGGDCGDEYNYAPPAADRLVTPRLRRVSLAQGLTRQTLTLELELSTPATLTPDRKSRSKETVLNRITSYITLTRGVPRVDIRTLVNNNARDHRLRVHFPAPFKVDKAEHDGHFEIVERRIGIPDYDETWVEQPRPEVPQRAFTSISDGQNRLTIANRGLPEVEVRQNASGNAEIVLTLLRCVGWLSRDDFSTRRGHAGPFIETPGAQMIGEWEFDYSIIVGQARLLSYQQSYAFETPLRAVFTDLHAGSLPPSGSFIETTPAEFLVSAVKESEDGRGWLVRGYNMTSLPITIRLHPWKPFRHVERINLAEEKIAVLPPATDGSVELVVHPHGIETVLFER